MPPPPTSTPAIDALLDRLTQLYPRLIDLSLGRLDRLLAALGRPERRLPPVIHVAGTNGKGSTCAFLRGIGEAAGMRVHVTTSPHLVRLNERFRVAGELVSDEALLATLARIEAVNGTQPITVFEVLMAAAFLLFAETPADLCILETGLGGRGDATNIIAHPVASAITSISMDHREMLGDTLELIAGEKAGIIKDHVPVVIGTQLEALRAVFDAAAATHATRVQARDRDWSIGASHNGLVFRDGAGSIALPPPSLLGVHQHDNLGIAVATMRAAGFTVAPAAFALGAQTAQWEARLQRLDGRLANSLPSGWELWLDGGHNPGAGLALAAQAQAWHDRPLHLIVGMKQAKDSGEFLRPLLPWAASVWAVAEPGQHLALPVEAIIAASDGVARHGPTVTAALAKLQSVAPADPARILICGSLYLAGEVLKLEGGEGEV